MKYKVYCYVSGKEFIVECYASSPSDAKSVALSQYPNARVTSVTAAF